MSDPASDRDEEIGIAGEIIQRTKRARFMQRILIFFLIIALVGGGFFLSFFIGKRVLIPIKTLPSIYIDTSAPKEVEEGLKSAAPKEPEIEEGVKQVESEPTVPLPAVSTAKGSAAPKYFKVQAGVFKGDSGAIKYADELKNKGFPTFIKTLPDGSYRVQVGAYEKRQFAEKLIEDLKKVGVTAIIVEE